MLLEKHAIAPSAARLCWVTALGYKNLFVVFNEVVALLDKIVLYKSPDFNVDCLKCAVLGIVTKLAEPSHTRPESEFSFPLDSVWNCSLKSFDQFCGSDQLKRLVNL